MSNSEYYGGGSSNPIAPTSTKFALCFLARANAASTDAWFLARGAINADGPLRVRLVDQLGQQLSDWSDVNSSSLERVKFTGVNIPASGGPFPPVIKVEANNRATSFQAVVEGVRIIYS